MANSPLYLHLFSTLLMIIISTAQAQQSKPTSLVFPIHKDPTTQLHIVNITQRTPRLSLPFVIDLNGHSLWENCDPRYRSSTYRAPPCGSPQCSLAGARACLNCSSSRPRPGCHNNVCGLTSINPVSHASALSELAEDTLSVRPITNAGSNAGNGESTRFWDEKWLGNYFIKQQFPNLHGVTRRPNATVAQFSTRRDHDNQIEGWNLHPSRRLTDLEIGEFDELCLRLEQAQLRLDREDYKRWIGDKSGAYTVQSANVLLRREHATDRCSAVETIWYGTAPSKVKFFAWTVWNGKVNTTEIIQRRRPSHHLQPSICVMCKNASESLNHLFLHCEFTTNLWYWLVSELKMNWVMPHNIKDCLEDTCIQRAGHRRKTLWRTGVLALVWGVWLERNCKIFNDKMSGWKVVQEQVKARVERWVLNEKGFENWKWNFNAGAWMDTG